MARLRPADLFRRLSTRGDHSTPTTNPTIASPSPQERCNSLPSPPRLPAIPSSPAASPKTVRKSTSLPRLRRRFLRSATPAIQESVKEERKDSLLSAQGGTQSILEGEAVSPASSIEPSTCHHSSRKSLEGLRKLPVLVLQQATPEVAEAEVRDVEPASVDTSLDPTPDEQRQFTPQSDSDLVTQSPSELPTTLSSPETEHRPSSTALERPVSIVSGTNAPLVAHLLDSPVLTDHPSLPTAAMVQRKIWVKRPDASATLVVIKEDDLVDDVREMILRKYANSLGKTFDAPDMTLSIVSRLEQGVVKNERVLGPEEQMCRTLDSYYPEGQTVHDALIINVPQRRTPRPSPKVYMHPNYHAIDDYRPLENGTDYFPPMPAFVPSTIPQTSGSHDSRSSQHHVPLAAQSETHPRSISILNTGQLPPLPSPGSTSRRHQHRPKYGRQPTASPTLIQPNSGVIGASAPNAGDPQARAPHRQSTRPRMDSSAAEQMNNAVPPPAPPLPTPPAPEAPPTNKNNSNPPTPSGMPNNANFMNLHAPQRRPRKTRKQTPEDRANSRGQGGKNDASAPSVSFALESAAVPPINVLIVEDNPINLKILEGLMKRLKVRWQTAMNGQIAVDKWMAGGFHLVLMDIQMPVMNGLQATKEIRRLERVNGIGVFGEVDDSLLGQQRSSFGNGEDKNGEGDEAASPANKGADDGKRTSTTDRLLVSESLFKSPVIIVALTASSLQSDRHEALAAGCNDFLTKPVNFVWLERKVKEWGCMQALIDYDGWRKWKDYAAEQEAKKSEAEKSKDREREEKDRIKAEKMAKLQEKQAKLKEEREKAAKKRTSLNLVEPIVHEEGVGGEEDVNMPTAMLKAGAECLKK
ncbi:hypothetical protein BDY17DRAFT_311146 [Neohortaea acidophila]|uniref:Response regulatory domain-containing protein n=1 Tax=Neohortaea acidophila TaxID=245834 RepID=A0A6A6PTD2_9PEZI|nr:uncharacterized protein BDY17DRAFT_311146 [Neohortaea acidophila]KAF2482723.1 hypothetical protein BDY17DRAFT_311146 [Neohortaea acidophila]